MSVRLRFQGIGLLLSLAIWPVLVLGNGAQEKPKEAAQEPASDKAKEAPAATPETAGKKNPVKATPEVLAAAKKVYGYDCAMCHGEKGDGKGELVESMSLKMKDWQEAGALDGFSDEAIYDLIVKGKDKMVGEGDRLAPPKVWGLVHYVRTLGKKKAP